MDYPCAEFGDFIFSRFGFIVRTDRRGQTEQHTDADNRLTHATTVDGRKRRTLAMMLLKSGFHYPS